jgi:hypothetical protein
MEWGTYHRFSPETVNGYMAENFWREEHRYTVPGERLFGFMCCMLRTGVCVKLKNYGETRTCREQASRKTWHKRVAAARAEAVDRLCNLGLLPEALVDEAVTARDNLREVERAPLVSMERQLEELTRRVQELETEKVHWQRGGW